MGLLLMLLALIAAVTLLGAGVYVLDLLQRGGGPPRVTGPVYRVPPPESGETQVGGYSLLAGDAEPLEIPEATVTRVRQLLAEDRDSDAVWLVRAHTGVDTHEAGRIVHWIRTQS
ncbi:hypothetical protein EFW17_23030 [Halostreptopolyspora alba]|uniref:Uncharacterized protein n=2 Tax=Halostreptopolyspora alba TaxID=2487137 RepID=A0A3N0DY71_9ACTN|nr:hypothetical protein EFW17_23030 [Nocardiopsaceae bacterium YIM 96095]